MVIKIRGGNKFQKKLIREYGKWLGDYLLGPRLSDNVEVLFKYNPELVEQEIEGYVDYEDPFGNTPPREFTVNINPALSTRELIECLAHEMVHVKQYAKGELKMNWKKNTATWHGVVYSANDMESYDHKYYTLPWEIEAHGREIGLYVIFLKETGKKQYCDGEFIANVYHKDGTFIYSCVMKYIDGVLKPQPGYTVYNSPRMYVTNESNPICARVDPQIYEAVTLTDDGYLLQSRITV